MIPFSTCIRPAPTAGHGLDSDSADDTIRVPQLAQVQDRDVNAAGISDQRRARPSIQVDIHDSDWNQDEDRVQRVESLDDQSSLVLSARIGRRRSSSSVRFADDTDTGTDILIITEDDLADILCDPIYPNHKSELAVKTSPILPADAYAAIPAPIAQHRRMVSGRRSLISASVHQHLQNGVYGMSLGAAGSEITAPRSGRMLLTLRRKKSLYKSLDADPITLLDHSYNLIVDRFLNSCISWEFSSFNLHLLTGGHSLSHLLIHLFKSYDLIRTFRLDLLCLWKCFRLFEQGYHDTNPYHNSVHAADVTQAMHCFLNQEKIAPFLTPIETMSAILAAVAHDLDHPGVNQHFLISTNSHLALLYSNTSVLESHHWRFAVSCIHESGVFDHFSPAEWDQVRYLLKSLILATDITQQPKYLSRLRKCLSSPHPESCLTMSEPENRLFILKIALKCADLANPCRSWELSRRWSEQICSEFYRQGDFERQLNLPVTPIFNRYEASMAKIQTDFFQSVVMPLFTLWDQFLSSDLSRLLITNLNFNYNQWQSFASKKLPERRHTIAAFASLTARPVLVRRRAKSIGDTACHQELYKLRNLYKRSLTLELESPADPDGQNRKTCDGVHGCGTPSSVCTPESDQSASLLEVCVNDINEDEDDLLGANPLDAEHGISSPDQKAVNDASFLQLPGFTFAPQYWGRRGSAPGCISIYTSAELAAAALVFLQGTLNPPRRSSAPVETASKNG